MNATTQDTFAAPSATLKGDSCNQVVAEHLPLVHKIARVVWRQVNKQTDYEELVSLGVQGLLEAMTRYEPGGAATLATFAYWRIRGNMLDGIGATAPLARNGYRQAQAEGRYHAHYNSKREVDSFTASGDDVETQACRRQEIAALASALSCLTREERHVIEEHYFAERSLSDAAADLGKSRSWACRKHAQALDTLRSEFGSADLLN